MCGIAGLLAPRLDPAERLARVGDMVARLRHRGPSGEALWDGGEAALGLARLAIVAPNQPARVASNESGTVHAVINGEVYNHAALRAELRGRGHQVPDGPDTAVIPHLYEERGADFPLALEGMFAVALWDHEAGRLVLARDRAGEKPLFVAEAPDRFGFASEPSALLSLPWVSRDPDPEALSRFLLHGFFAGDETGFAAIRQLPPAHVQVVEPRGSGRVRYWRPWDSLEPPARTDAAAAIASTRRALERAVAERVPGEVPFGVFLSGGVDSSAVAALAARAHRTRFPTYSLRLPDRGYDESEYARSVAERIGSEHHELTLDAGAGEQAIEDYAAAMDLPLGDPSVLPTWALARRAARDVPVVLTGEGGDELFAGYPTYLGHRWARRAARLPAPLRRALIAFARRIRPRHHHVTIPYLIERFLDAAALSPYERHAAWFGTATAAEAAGLLAPSLRSGLPAGAPTLHLDRLWSSIGVSPAAAILRKPELVAYQLADFELYLPGDLLTKVDRSTMEHGLESRAPFLAHPLIEAALALPSSLQVRGKTGKWVLKRAVSDLLPDAVRTRRKQGFSPPFSAWARGPLLGLVRSRLAPDRIARAGVLDSAAVGAIVEAHLSGRAERGRTLWTLLSLQMWAERWQVGRIAAPVAAHPTGQPAPVALAAAPR
jgi:asparagine synthase (glutamine-hydrolysing)